MSWVASSISSYFVLIPEVDNVVMPFLDRLKTVISSPKIKTMTDQELDEAIKEEREKHALAQRHANEGLQPGARMKVRNRTLERLQQERTRREEKKRIKKQNTVIIVVAFVAMCIYNLFFR